MRGTSKGSAARASSADGVVRPGVARRYDPPPMMRPDERLSSRRTSCVGLAGGSPAAVSAVAPRSRSQAEGEIRPPERDVESLSSDVRRSRGSEVAGPTRERELCSLERLKPQGEEAEPLMSRRRQQTARNGRMRAGLLRGMGEGTRRQPDTEQERSSSTALVGASDDEQAASQAASRREEVRGVRSTADVAGQNRGGGKEPCFGRAGWRR